MDKDDLIVPVRTRGAVRARTESAPEAPPAGPIRTRGAVRTRGKPAGQAPGAGAELRSVSISAFFDRLRSESQHFPVTVVIYGWGGKSAEQFLTALIPYLRREDAVVLVPSNRNTTKVMPSVPASAMLLDMDRPSHRLTYENGHLAGDIVFFGEPGEVDGSAVARWKRAARAVVVQQGAARAAAVLELARRAQLFTWQWSANGFEPAA